VNVPGQPPPWGQQSQPLYPAYAPPPPPSRRWFPIAVIAAIIIAGGMIAAAIVITGGAKTSQPAAAPSTTAQPDARPTESTATCKAWDATDAAMTTIPASPEGWDWHTPNIDTLIANQKGAIDQTLSIFESKIAPDDPQQVVEAAKTYIATKRTDLNNLTDHTVTEADDAAVEESLATLQQLCGVKDHG
jgi:hypothetical protein